MGDGWGTEEAGAEETSLKAGEAVMETRTRVLTVEIEVSQGFCEPHDSVLIIFVFGAWNHLLGNFCLSFQSHLQQPPPGEAFLHHLRWHMYLHGILSNCAWGSYRLRSIRTADWEEGFLLDPWLVRVVSGEDGQRAAGIPICGSGRT